MKELLVEINAKMQTFRTESAKFAEEGNKSAGVRARKATLALEKLFKQFRKESVKLAKKHRAIKSPPSAKPLPSKSAATTTNE